MDESHVSARVPSADEKSEINSMLAAVELASPDVDWKIYIPEKQYGVVIKLPYDCFITGTLNIGENEQNDIYIDMVSVNEKLRSNGIGPKLERLLAEEAKKYGAVSLSGHITSEEALSARMKAFEGSEIEFSDRATGKPLGSALNSDGKIDCIAKIRLN